MKRNTGLVIMTVCAAALVPSGCTATGINSPEKAGGRGNVSGGRHPKTYVLTWTNYDGMSDPEDAVYVFQGKTVGKRAALLKEVEEADVRKGDVVQVDVPWRITESGPDRLPAPALVRLMEDWLRRGVKVKYREEHR